MTTVAVDAMGGDHAPGAAVAGAVEAVREMGASVALVGLRDRIENELDKLGARSLGIRIVQATEVVGMDESPVAALRKKKDTSIRVGLGLVGSGECAAFVSAGNSGAVMAVAVVTLGNLSGIERPAIALELPSARQPVTLIDAGANVDCTPLNLVQSAVMGDIFARTVRGLVSPRIGLVSNGTEASKGTTATRDADSMLRHLPLNYVGYIEGRDIGQGNVDVAVTDGFTGNVILKTMEGFGKLMSVMLRRMFERNLRTKLAYLLLRKDLDWLRSTFDDETVGGAPLLGVDGVTIIAHGSSSAWAIRNAIRVAADAAGKDLTGQISRTFTETPEFAEVASLGKRRGIWQQIRGRFRGRGDRANGAPRGEEGAEEAGAAEADPKPDADPRTG